MKLNKRYRRPSRGYITNSVISPMYVDTKEVIITKLKAEKYVSLTADGWKSLAQNSYSTVTAQICNQEFKVRSHLQPKVPFYTNQNFLLAYLLSKIYILGILNWPLGNTIACSFHNCTIMSSRPLLWKYVVFLKKLRYFFKKFINQ